MFNDIIFFEIYGEFTFLLSFWSPPEKNLLKLLSKLRVLDKGDYCKIFNSANDQRNTFLMIIFPTAIFS